MKKNILFTLAIVWQLVLLAQNNVQLHTDSLIRMLKSNMQDSARVNTMNALATDLSKDNPDSSIALSSAALTLSQKINYKSGEANSYFSLGQIYTSKSKSQEALNNFEQALKIYEISSQQEGIAEASYAIGLVHQRSTEII